MSMLLPIVVSAKKNVCTITLNSDNEKKLFQSRYKGEDIQFTELTNFKKGLKNENDWFTKACESGIQCDSLIISGHFAGTFFGEHTDLTLPLETLDEKSCSRKCQGILNNPSEVYLFGCNTLADKGKDSRSPAEYKKVLLEHGISDEYADRIVASRYSPIGQSFKTSMEKIFSGVTKIYGFDSVGPLGRDVEPKLKNYLDQIPNYSNRLEELSGMKVMALISKTTEIGNNFNLQWGKAMNGTNYSSCAGRLTDDRKECGLFDKNKTMQEKLLLAESLLNGENRSSYFLSVEEFLKDKDFSKLSEDEMTIVKRISAQSLAAADLRAAMPKLEATPELKYKMMDLGKRFGWMDQGFMNSEYEKQMRAAAKNGFRGEVTTSLCSIKNPPEITPANIKSEWFKAPGFVYILGCWQSSSGGKLSGYAQTELSKQISNPDSDVATAAMTMLTDAGRVDPDTQVRIAEQLYSRDSGVAASAMTNVAKIKNPDSRVLQVVARGLSSSNPDERRRSAYTVRNLKLQDPALKQKALQIAPDMQPW
ncbi:MAG: hypothetical protein JSU04_06555 [Bdellovibrionales bacterium]|nr:hypothetical protein [Bdellovibrionales bacterium]